jgi:hypothetical protein
METSNVVSAEVHAEGHHGTVLITVNGKPVRLSTHEATGLQIKEAAIAQQVQIELSFILELEEHGKTRIISDGETVHLHEGSSFTAIRNDDNS